MIKQWWHPFPCRFFLYTCSITIDRTVGVLYYLHAQQFLATATMVGLAE